MKALQGQGQALADALNTLFNEPRKEESFPTPILEVRGNRGVKRFKFDPDDVEQLTLTMHIVTTALNNYL